MTKTLMNNLREFFSWNCTDSWANNISVSVRVNFENFGLKIVDIVLSFVGWYPRKTLSVNKTTTFKRPRLNILRANIKFEYTLWGGVLRVTWTIINWSRWIYNGTVSKMTKSNPNYLGISRVSIIQFCIGLGWGGGIKVRHEICDCKIHSSIFMKQHSIYCINI